MEGWVGLFEEALVTVRDQGKERQLLLAETSFAKVYWEPSEYLLVCKTGLGTHCIHGGTVKRYLTTSTPKVSAALKDLCEALGIQAAGGVEVFGRVPLTEHWDYGPILLWHRLQSLGEQATKEDQVIVERLAALSYDCEAFRNLTSDRVRNCICYDLRTDGDNTRPRRKKKRKKEETRQRENNTKRWNSAACCLACRRDHQQATNHLVMCQNVQKCGGIYHQQCLRPVVTRCPPVWKCWKCVAETNGWICMTNCWFCRETTKQQVLDNGNRRACLRCKQVSFFRINIPVPGWGTIPHPYRGKDEHFEVRQSSVGKGKAGLGVFTARDVPAGTCLIFGGDIIYDFCDDDENPYDLAWDQYYPSGIRGIGAYYLNDQNQIVKRTRGWLAPLVNEPDVTGQKANCCFASNSVGLYLVICRDLDPDTELLVHYGLGYHPTQDDDQHPLYPPPPLSQDLTIKEKNTVLSLLSLPLVEMKTSIK
jgi:hypothetical protein